jgi:2-amino-4-hydroxy-6-hydroxymethyldihydropteridine diphosphokinase
MKKVYLGLGSSMGDREDFLRKAVALLGQACGPIIDVSPVYVTGPVGFESEHDFLNMVIMLQTDIIPAGLVKTVLELEASLGRIRGRERYSPRTIDIDILLYGDEIIDEPSVTIPHPRMHERRFVLVPLNDIAPEVIHPVFKKDIRTLLEECPDKSGITPFTVLF